MWGFRCPLSTVTDREQNNILKRIKQESYSLINKEEVLDWENNDQTGAMSK